MLTELSAVSPIDGRYGNRTKELREYFSEGALIKYRVRVEIKYFISLCELPLPQLATFDRRLFSDLSNIYLNFTDADAQEIKDIEKTTNHDVKAVEYFIKRHFDRLQLGEYKEFIHFGLTSQDINNTATPLLLKEAIEEIMLPAINNLNNTIKAKAREWQEIPMLAHTHGQPASPTILGKEFGVFTERIDNQLALLNQIPHSAKFGGATGNMNAHVVAYPNSDWVSFANKFVSEELGLERLQTTTQIEHYDNMAAIFDTFKRLDTIMIDLCRDIWTYISMDYFKQRIVAGEVGSSAMPHKVNPIDFENAEGNLGMANAILEFLAGKLPASRLQRDLTDSTVTRNIGVPLAHILISVKSIEKGLSKLILNHKALDSDLESNWAVVAEAIQTILRREAYPSPYEALKELTRTNAAINRESIGAFIEGLKVSKNIKEELRQITPQNYTGIKFRI